MRRILSNQVLVRTSLTCVALLILFGLGSCNEQRKAGFCNPGKPGRNVSNPSNTEGTGCTLEEAKRNAEHVYANENCTGNDDPKCPEGCADEQKKCQKTVEYVDPPSNPAEKSIMECTSKEDNTCPGGKKYTCKLRPRPTVPAECSCACY